MDVERIMWVARGPAAGRRRGCDAGLPAGAAGQPALKPPARQGVEGPEAPPGPARRAPHPAQPNIGECRMPKQLKDRRIAILATNGFEPSEPLDPRKALSAEGARVDVVAPKSGRIRGWQVDEDRTSTRLNSSH